MWAASPWTNSITLPTPTAAGHGRCRLLPLPHTQFMLMSATLGDVTAIAASLEEHTGATCDLVVDAPRPVPLSYDYVTTSLEGTVELAMRRGEAPLYIVHFSQDAALATAQSLANFGIASKEQREAIKEAAKGTSFSTAFGKILKRLLGCGVGVHYMLAISALMVLWILLRSIKFSIDNTDAERLLWYFYYFPMLFIPMLSVFVSQSLGKGEDFRLPRWTKLLYLPTLLLLLLVLTNDLHQQVFSFPSGILSDREYRYEVGFFFVLGWETLCAGFAFLSMVKNCRIPHSRRIRWLPLVPFALSLAYAYMYAKNVYWVWVLAGDMTVSQCLIFASILECCIQSGLIHSNLGYDELFEATSLPVQITDQAFCSKYVSAAMQGTLPQSKLRHIQQDTVYLDDDTLLKRHKLRRGWVFWKEDISALSQVQKKLELTRDELHDTGDVLAAENAQHARWLKLTEQNRLYDMMEAQIDRQIAMLWDLLAELQKTEDQNRARRLLGQVIIIGTYIKRRSNLIFVGAQRGAISVQELRLCLNESSENICVYGADCKAIVKGEDQLTLEQATQIYDLFEAVVETELESLRAMLISIDVGAQVEVSFCVSAAEPLCGLRAHFQGLEWEQDEDGLQYVTRKLERSRR